VESVALLFLYMPQGFYSHLNAETKIIGIFKILLIRGCYINRNAERGPGETSWLRSKAKISDNSRENAE